ncbi:hypothetical protein KIW84_076292 [Lathyrus oleraceus]|uniref:Uncharacterized protein n=1 Tax=Pisum sativum TaxID=3888 RepID=A0A9D4VXS7_PEA|nr:hypothetical protein KIW84_076292 [Pisum sativum]
MSLSEGLTFSFKSFWYSNVSPFDFFNSTKWKTGVISKISASIPKRPFLPSFKPSNLSKPPSFFFNFSPRLLQISSNLEMITETGLLDVNRISVFRSFSSNKLDKSKPDEKEMISKAFKLLQGFGRSTLSPFSEALNTSSMSRGASSLLSVSVTIGFFNPFLNQELSMILAKDILDFGFGSNIFDNNLRTSDENQLGYLKSALPIFLYISIKFGSLNGRKPANITYKITPHDHISALVPSYPFRLITSGATYAGVPHVVWSNPSWCLVLASALNPKSETFKFSFSSNKRFSGFKSR